MSADDAIRDILQRHGEKMETGTVWRVQGTPVILHKALERIAAKADIVFERPTIIRAERDEAVILVVGKIGDNEDYREEWSIGEALIGANYRVSGKQAAYVYAMAEKRAKDRVILKLIGLHGLAYSEEEADEFKAPQQSPPEAQSAQRVPAADDGSPQAIEARLRELLAQTKTYNAITDLMLAPETQAELASLAPGIRDSVREFAKERMSALGWPSRNRGDAR